MMMAATPLREPSAATTSPNGLQPTGLPMRKPPSVRPAEDNLPSCLVDSDEKSMLGTVPFQGCKGGLEVCGIMGP